jgi:hypothetical protein
MGTMNATFEQWLEFVFNNRVRKPKWYRDQDFDSRWEALELTDALIVQYMTRLFLAPTALRSYSLDQVDQGLWFLFGESSPRCSSETLLRREAKLPERVACIHAMSSFFRNFILAVTPDHQLAVAAAGIVRRLFPLVQLSLTAEIGSCRFLQMLRCLFLVLQLVGREPSNESRLGPQSNSRYEHRVTLGELD